MLVLRRLNSVGDTIIEVLFAITVIGIVLAGSYGVVNRSVLAEEDAQQHGIALGLAQKQIEMLRSYTLNTVTATPVLIFNSSPGCFYYNASGDITPTTSFSATFCSSKPNGGETYTVKVTSDSISIYTVNVSWPGVLSSSSTDSISIPYRISLN